MTQGDDRLKNFRAYLLFWSVLLVLLLADQATKNWIYANLSLQDSIEVVPGFFWIVHVHNYGAAWGILSGFGWLLSALAVGALAGIYFYRRILHLEETYMQLVFGLLCSGIVGNLVDRVRLGYVIDFLDFLLGSYRWPAFNIADSAIFCGVALYLVHSWRNPEA